MQREAEACFRITNADEKTLATETLELPLKPPPFVCRHTSPTPLPPGQFFHFGAVLRTQFAGC